METIEWNDFIKVELRLRRILEVQDFPKAKEPTYIVYVDFGTELGIR